MKMAADAEFFRREGWVGGWMADLNLRTSTECFLRVGEKVLLSTIQPGGRRGFMNEMEETLQQLMCQSAVRM